MPIQTGLTEFFLYFNERSNLLLKRQRNVHGPKKGGPDGARYQKRTKRKVAERKVGSEVHTSDRCKGKGSAHARLNTTQGKEEKEKTKTRRTRQAQGPRNEVKRQ